jgi:hypothetical protein
VVPLLRDFVRNHVFEHFPAFAGACVGIAHAILLAWVLLLVREPGALPVGGLLATAAGFTALHAWLMPRVGLARPATRIGGTLAHAYLAVGFASIVVAAFVATTALAFFALSPLLAFAKVSPDAGLAGLRTATAIAGAGVALVLAHGFQVAPRRLTVDRVAVPIAALDPRLAGFRIVHLSDLHVGNGLEGARLDAVVARANELAGDLVVLTGDLFDHDPRALAAGAASLGGLRARHGVVAVLGNHDWMTGLDEVAAALAKHAPGIRLLRDEVITLDAAASVHVAGAEDPGHDWTEGGGTLPAIDRLAAALPASGLRILLVHRPDGFPQAAARGFQLVLAGHFHGGQLAFPVASGRWNAAKLLTRFDRGLFGDDASRLYVSRGLGFAGPRVRIGADREIAVLTLEPASPAA